LWAEQLQPPSAAFAQEVIVAAMQATRNDQLLTNAMDAWRQSVDSELSADAALAAQTAIMAACDGAATTPMPAHNSALAQALSVWASDGIAPLPADFADSIVAKISVPESGVVPSQTQSAPAQTDNVGTVVRGPRRWWLSASSVVAIAAISVLAISLGRRPKPPVGPHGATQHSAQTAGTHTETAHSQQQNHRPNREQLEPAAPREQLLASALGSVAEKVQVEGERTSVRVLSVQSEQEGATIAVVWIEDGDKQSM
jgi:hypothetical protein